MPIVTAHQTVGLASLQGWWPFGVRFNLSAVMLFLNHSCDPNVGFAGNVVLVAMRDVSPGEELTTDYALFDDYEGSMRCRCGSASCRGIVDGRDWRRAELQARYRGYFS